MGRANYRKQTSIGSTRSTARRAALHLLLIGCAAVGLAAPGYAYDPPSTFTTAPELVATNTAVKGFGGLSRADDFGVWSYKTLREDLAGTGLQAHHLVEKRFAPVMGQSADDMASIAVTKAEHQAFTNAWRNAIPYGANGTGAATRAQVEAAARQIYAGYPSILKALGL